jgi:hypothetical protein
MSTKFGLEKQLEAVRLIFLQVTGLRKTVLRKEGKYKNDND